MVRGTVTGMVMVIKFTVQKAIKKPKSKQNQRANLIIEQNKALYNLYPVHDLNEITIIQLIAIYIFET